MTADPAATPRRPDRAVATRAPAPGRLGRVALHLAVIAPDGHLADPDDRPARQLVPARRPTSPTSGWWTALLPPVPASRSSNYHDVLDQSEHGRRRSSTACSSRSRRRSSRSSSRRSPPTRSLDEVPGPRTSCSWSSSGCWSSRCRRRSSRSCSCSGRGPGHRRARSWRCGWPTPATACRSRSSCCATSWASLPKEVFESASIDGASHVTAFFRLALPMSVPGHRGAGDLPVPVRLERPARRADLHRRRRTRTTCR